MPDAALPDATVLTSSFWDPYVREQLVTTCTSSTRPSPVAGRFIFETDTKLTLVYDGTAWVAIAGPVPWTAVGAFANSWVNFGAPYGAAQYRKVADVVSLRGAIKSGTINTAAFTLPVGFRPPTTISLPVAGFSGGVIGVLLQITPSGLVTVFTASNAEIQLQTCFSITA